MVSYVMFCKDDRCERWVYYHPLVETRGYKMLDVIGNQSFMFFLSAKILSETCV